MEPQNMAVLQERGKPARVKLPKRLMTHMTHDSVSYLRPGAGPNAQACFATKYDESAGFPRRL